jgi:hypothetical protein
MAADNNPAPKANQSSFAVILFLRDRPCLLTSSLPWAKTKQNRLDVKVYVVLFYSGKTIRQDKCRIESLDAIGFDWTIKRGVAWCSLL